MKATQRLLKTLYYVASRPPHWTWQALNRLIGLLTEKRPIFPGERFDWVPAVEACYPEVRKEVERLLQHVEDMPTVHDIIPTTGYYYSRRDWRQVAFYSYGTRIDDHCALYPNVWKAFSQIPGLVSGTVSIVAPHEIVPDHSHSYKGLLIFHMGVVIPQSEGGCGIRVGDETRTWHEGEVFAIDPTYSHEVWNRTDHYRVILLGEFRRPDLPFALKFLDHLFIFAFRVSLGRMLVRHARQLAAKHRKVVEQEIQPAAG